jgi:hypothetical protein
MNYLNNKIIFKVDERLVILRDLNLSYDQCLQEFCYPHLHPINERDAI